MGTSNPLPPELLMAPNLEGRPPLPPHIKPENVLSYRRPLPPTPFFAQTGPFFKRRFFGSQGQTILQIGASVGLLITFVMIPTLRNFVRDWQKREYDASSTRNLIHEKILEKRIGWREEMVNSQKK